MPGPKAKRRRISEETKTYNLEEVFCVKFNPDLEEVWKWACRSDTDNPLDSLYPLLNLKLCGVFQYLQDLRDKRENTLFKDEKGKPASKDKEKAGDINRVSEESVKLHMLDRDWQCPPEFQPCARNKSHLFGFWRDTPTENPIFVVEKKKGCGVITPVATDLFDLIRVLSKRQKVSLSKDLDKLINKHALTEDLRKITATRNKTVVAKTFNKIGIVVPISKNDVGYRPLTMTYGELDNMLTKSCETEDETKKDKILAPFDECINYIQFANDECDYGMGFEMGMCVYSHATSRNFMGTISSLLPLSYDLLGRTLYSKIMRKTCEEAESGTLL